MKEGTKNKATPKGGLLFGRQNYMIIFIGIGVLIIGYLLMVGGSSDDPTVFNKEEVYHWRRITVAPIVVITGYVIMIYAIFKKPKTEKSEVTAEPAPESDS